jgi:hypothetical protein
MTVEDLSEHREWMKSVPEQLDDKKVNRFIFFSCFVQFFIDWFLFYLG